VQRVYKLINIIVSKDRKPILLIGISSVDK
jgi:hypothetical protein